MGKNVFTAGGHGAGQSGRKTVTRWLAVVMSMRDFGTLQWARAQGLYPKSALSDIMPATALVVIGHSTVYNPCIGSCRSLAVNVN